jgi:hypothetical protein
MRGSADLSTASRRRQPRRVFVAGLLLLSCISLRADPVKVIHTEGMVHGFLVLRALDGTTLAEGDLVQTANGSRVSARVTFRFRDGSLQEETAAFTQQGHFVLLSDRLVQKGPAFPRPLEMTIDAVKGKATVVYTDDGKQKTASDGFTPTADLANGIIPVLLKNVRPGNRPASVSYIAATPKPRLVKLEISSASEETFSIAGAQRTATHYVLKVDIGGLSGLLAPLVGKQPPDAHVWILGGEAPAFVKSEQLSFVGGPLWRIELTSPVWPNATRGQ